MFSVLHFLPDHLIHLKSNYLIKGTFHLIALQQCHLTQIAEH